MKGTIKSKNDIERLFRTGRRSSSYLMTILVLDVLGGENQAGRCAYIAGKKLGNAPLRSRCKRVMREAARELGAPWRGKDVVFVAKRKVAVAQHDKIVDAMRKQLQEHEVLDGGR